MLNLPVYCELKVHIISAVNQTNQTKEKMGRNEGSGGEHRSNYGLKTYTPEEMKNQWKERVEVLCSN
jgi:hypothetical protein